MLTIKRYTPNCCNLNPKTKSVNNKKLNSHAQKQTYIVVEKFIKSKTTQNNEH